jgi:hypothetical protein
MEADRDRAMSSGSRGMLEAFRVRGRLDGKGGGALGDEHPRQAAAKVQGWSGREEFGVGVERIWVQDYSPRALVVSEGGLCRELIEWALAGGPKRPDHDKLACASCLYA